MSQMSPTDFRNRIRELAEEAGFEVLRDSEKIVALNRCWVDAQVSCPYGSPEGQYILRPEAFCNQDCPTFGSNGVSICSDEEMQEQVSNDLREHFDTNAVGLVSELETRAEELPDAIESGILQLAADLLNEKKMNRRILLEDDLPD